MRTMGESLPLIDRVKTVGDYRLRLWFSDGQSGEWDFSHLADDPRPIVAPFKDVSFFQSVFLDYGALTWPNGYDLNPVGLHDKMSAAGALSRERKAA